MRVSLLALAYLLVVVLAYPLSGCGSVPVVSYAPEQRALPVAYIAPEVIPDPVRWRIVRNHGRAPRYAFGAR